MLCRWVSIAKQKQWYKQKFAIEKGRYKHSATNKNVNDERREETNSYMQRHINKRNIQYAHAHKTDRIYKNLHFEMINLDESVNTRQCEHDLARYGWRMMIERKRDRTDKKAVHQNFCVRAFSRARILPTAAPSRRHIYHFIDTWIGYNKFCLGKSIYEYGIYYQACTAFCLRVISELTLVSLQYPFLIQLIVRVLRFYISGPHVVCASFYSILLHIHTSSCCVLFCLTFSSRIAVAQGIQVE